MYCCLYHGAILQSIAPNYITYLKKKPVPVATRCKTNVCGRSPAETVGSNPAGAWMFVVSVECCQVEVSALGLSLVQRSPTVYGVSLCVIYKPKK